MNKKNNKKEKGFVILISIMVSLILLSVGAFIASVAVREIMLSSSAKQSQAAFFAADAVLECALFKEFKEGGFDTTNYATHNQINSLSCNGKNFD
jgi:Tfp pilus assembly protein PilE